MSSEHAGRCSIRMDLTCYSLKLTFGDYLFSKDNSTKLTLQEDVFSNIVRACCLEGGGMNVVIL